MRRNNRPPTMPGQVPILGQQPTREEAMRAAVMQQIGGLTKAIYTDVAVSHLVCLEAGMDADRELLKSMARNANVAAQAYFEGLGVIEPLP